MNKGQLVEAISRDAGITKTQAQDALDAFVKNVQRSLKGGDKVTIVGFGTFSASTRAARVGRNPQTGQPINIPAKKVAKFSAGKALKEAIQ
ncbi:MAG: HU family DNA-binding protein [Acidobacteria bacterium]|nr:HU family DNA-binding protein [Acidobacteriota bacterium]